MRMRSRVVGVLLLGVTTLAGCGGSGSSPDWEWGPFEASRVWHEAGGHGVPAFRIRLPDGVDWVGEVDDGGIANAAPEGRGGCDRPVWSARQDGAGSSGLVFEAFSLATSCRIDASANSSPLNGEQPAYRTVADIPPEVAERAREVDTALGSGLVFTQEYEECTNECTTYAEPFVVITLDPVADPAHPVLMFTSRHGVLSEGELADIATDQLELPRAGR